MFSSVPFRRRMLCWETIECLGGTRREVDDDKTGTFFPVDIDWALAVEIPNPLMAMTLWKQIYPSVIMALLPGALEAGALGDVAWIDVGTSRLARSPESPTAYGDY